MSRHTITFHVQATYDQEVNAQQLLENVRGDLLAAVKYEAGTEPVIIEATVTEGASEEKWDTWTVFGYWTSDGPSAELAIQGEHQDTRPDDMTGEKQPWCTFAWARNVGEALSKAIAEMEQG